MTEEELKIEARYLYRERMGILEIWGTPTAEQHNAVVLEVNQAIIKLRENDSLVAKLRNLRLSL